MLLCICPHCCASFEVEDRGVGKSAPCPFCNHRVRIDSPSQCETAPYLPAIATTAPDPFAFRRGKTPARSVRADKRAWAAGRWLLLASVGFAIPVGFALCCGCLVWIARQPAPSVHRGGIQSKDDPYPDDCAVVRAWLKDKYGKVEIRRWGRGGLTGIAGLGEYRTFTVRFQQPGYAEQGATVTVGPDLQSGVLSVTSYTLSR